MRTITPTDVIHNIPSIGTWVPEIDQMTGSLQWSSPESSLFIFATPEFSNVGEVPFDTYDDESGTYEHIFTLCLMVDSSITEQIEYYKTTLENIIKFLNLPI